MAKPTVLSWALYHLSGENVNGS